MIVTISGYLRKKDSYLARRGDTQENMRSIDLVDALIKALGDHEIIIDPRRSEKVISFFSVGGVYQPANVPFLLGVGEGAEQISLFRIPGANQNNLSITGYVLRPRIGAGDHDHNLELALTDKQDGVRYSLKYECEDPYGGVGIEGIASAISWVTQNL